MARATFSVSRASSGGWMSTGFHKSPTRDNPGTASLRSRRRSPARAMGARMYSPVMLPPGRARFLTIPSAVGSPLVAMTMGIVVVTCLADSVAGDPRVTITSTGRRTSSLARSENRSARPSADRYSITTFWPST